MSEKIKELLSQPLDQSLVMERKVAGSKTEYLAGHSAIRNANRIFGFDGWSYSITSLILTPCGENQNGNKVVSGQCIVKIEAFGRWAEDVGYGEGIAKALPAANESAGKEAVTDSLKRALRTWGDQFGNGLYDKRFDHTWVPDVDEDVLASIAKAKTVKELESIFKAQTSGTYNAAINARKLELQKEEKK